MNILILGSLPKTSEEENLYNTIIKVANKFATEVKSPIDTAAFKGTETERYDRAFQTVAEADIVIGEQSSPSTGQGMEIRECDNLNKPLIVVAKEGSKISGLVKGCPATRTIIFYRDTAELQSDLDLYLTEALRKN